MLISIAATVWFFFSYFAPQEADIDCNVTITTVLYIQYLTYYADCRAVAQMQSC